MLPGAPPDPSKMTSPACLSSKSSRTEVESLEQMVRLRLRTVEVVPHVLPAEAVQRGSSSSGGRLISAKCTEHPRRCRGDARGRADARARSEAAARKADSGRATRATRRSGSMVLPRTRSPPALAILFVNVKCFLGPFGERQINGSPDLRENAFAFLTNDAVSKAPAPIKNCRRRASMLSFSLHTHRRSRTYCCPHGPHRHSPPLPVRLVGGAEALSGCSTTYSSNVLVFQTSEIAKLRSIHIAIFLAGWFSRILAAMREKAALCGGMG